jgi:hypothetical protein
VSHKERINQWAAFCACWMNQLFKKKNKQTNKKKQYL